VGVAAWVFGREKRETLGGGCLVSGERERERRFEGVAAWSTRAEGRDSKCDFAAKMFSSSSR